MGRQLPVHPAGTLQLKVSRLRQALENAEPGGGGWCIPVTGLSAADRRRRGRRAPVRALVGGPAPPGSPGPRRAACRCAGVVARPAAGGLRRRHVRSPAIARLEEQRLVALEEQAEARLALGEHSLLTGELGELVAAIRCGNGYGPRTCSPLPGRQAEAVTSYGELRGRLADDLGLVPGPDLAALYQAILEQAPDLQRVQAPATLSPAPDEPSGHAHLRGPPDRSSDRPGRVAERTPAGDPHRSGRRRREQRPRRRRRQRTPSLMVSGWSNWPGPRSPGPHPRRRGHGCPGHQGRQRHGLVRPAGRRAAHQPDAADPDKCEHLVDQAAKLTAQVLLASPGLHMLVTSREPPCWPARLSGGFLR